MTSTLLSGSGKSGYSVLRESNSSRIFLADSVMLGPVKWGNTNRLTFHIMIEK
jgi:hypothetical protein